MSLISKLYQTCEKQGKLLRETIYYNCDQILVDVYGAT